MLKTSPNFMSEALKQARRAADEGEIPVGAVIVCDGQIVSRAYNQVERLHDPTAHAEMIAITAASNHLSTTHLKDCVLYVTLQPCPMCLGAIREAQIKKVVYGAEEGRKPEQFPQMEQSSELEVNDCRELLRDFFSKLRGA